MIDGMKVRDVLRRLADDRWTQVGQRGSHRQFARPTKPGKVTINGHPGDEIPGGPCARFFSRRAGPGTHAGAEAVMFEAEAEADSWRT